MMATTLGRSVSPDTIRHIWSNIDHLQQSGQPTTMENISERIAHLSNWNLDEVRLKVYGAVDSGLLNQNATAENTSTQFSINLNPSDTTVEPEHDWYCFECHSSGPVIGCTSCFRVYHPTCLSVPADQATFSCPVCESEKALCAIDDVTLCKQLDNILIWVHRKGGAGFALPSGSSNLTKDQYGMLIARDMDLGAMRTKLNTQKYPTPRHFLADFLLLVHNIVILYGKEGTLSRLAQELLKHVKSEVMTLEPANEQIIITSDTGVHDDQAYVEQESVRSHGHKRVSVKSDGPTPKKRRSAGPLMVKSMEEENMHDVWSLDDGFKKMVMDLQRHWLVEYQQSREKLLVDLTEKLHQEFLSDQQKIRTELLTQFKDELDTTRQELEQKYRDTLKQELQKMGEKHRKEISNTKKKQWCWQCEAEAIYHCCWNTAYCSVECQQAHWPTHRKYCRRKKSSSSTGAQ